ncbi:hypothetical protein [Pedomonas mirosovicensis]|nr:hypothetical protein [Pedomonas mirosovicensis]
MSDQPNPKKNLRGRNIALGLALFAFVVIVYLMSIARMGGGS